jgi:aminopeptidase-like protein
MTLFKLAEILFPINRSLTGKGNFQTLKIIKEICKNIKIKKYKSGKKVFDWNIPLEWNVNYAYIKTPEGKKICDYKKNNLHLVGYSTSVNKTLNLKNLKKKLYTHPKLNNAIPYLTSYYKKDWGFCISKNELHKLKPGKYQVNIDSTFKKGHMHFAECYIKGESKKEVFFSTYICHPSMANNEISGPVITTMLAKWLASKKKLKYSYRLIFIPETIGSIAYLYHNHKKIKKDVIAGFNVTCVGDERNWSLLPSKHNSSILDKVTKKILDENKIKYKVYNWMDRGSDERQYSSPGIDIQITSLMRSKYNTYPEYHTSNDRLGKVVTNKGLKETLKIYKKIILEFEEAIFPLSKVICEPMLSKRNLYPTINKLGNKNKGSVLLNFLTLSDGKTPIFEIKERIQVSKKKLNKICNILIKEKLIKLNSIYDNSKS